MLLPEPEPALDPPLVPMPVLGEVELVLGEVGLVVVEPDMPLPLAPAPAEPERLSCRHFSRSAPVNPTHLLGTSVDAPLAAESLVLGVLPGVPLAPPLMPTPGRSLAPVVLLPAEPLPPAPDEAPLAPDEAPLEPEPEPEPEPCARVAVDSARSAAAVAAVRVFNIMMGISSK